MVTACDLTMCGKPWPVNKEVAATLYEEFYTQVGGYLLARSFTHTPTPCYMCVTARMPAVFVVTECTHYMCSCVFVTSLL